MYTTLVMPGCTIRRNEATKSSLSSSSSSSRPKRYLRSFRSSCHALTIKPIVSLCSVITLERGINDRCARVRSISITDREILIRMEETNFRLYRIDEKSIEKFHEMLPKRKIPCLEDLLDRVSFYEFIPFVSYVE